MEKGVQQQRTSLRTRKNQPPIKSKPLIRTKVKKWASEHRIHSSAVEELLGLLPAVNAVMIRKDLMEASPLSPCTKRKESELSGGDDEGAVSPATNKRLKTASLEYSSNETAAKSASHEMDSKIEHLQTSIEEKMERFLSALTSKITVMDQKLDALLTHADERRVAIEFKLDENVKIISSLRDEFLSFKKSCKPCSTTTTTTTGLPKVTSKLPSLPAQSISELQTLERLLEDQDQQTIFINTLKKIGGAREATVVHSIMRFIMSKEVAMRFSLRGKFGKHSLDKLRIYHCVMEALKQNRKTQAMTDHELNVLIGNHLAQSNPRVPPKGPNTSIDELGLSCSPQASLLVAARLALHDESILQGPSTPTGGVVAKTESLLENGGNGIDRDIADVIASNGL